MLTAPARSTEKVSLTAAPMAVYGMAGLVLMASFFASRTQADLPQLRLAEARLDFLIHLGTNLAFLATLWINARRRRDFLRMTFLAPLAWLIFLGMAASASPIPAAAFEDWMYWLDAILLFYIGQMLIAYRPEIFFLLFAFVGNTLGLLAARQALDAPQAIPAEYVLAIVAGLSLAAGGIFAGRKAPGRQRSFLRFMLVAAVIGALGWLVYAVAPAQAGTPQWIALHHILQIRPWIGCGLGAIPEILPSFAAQDFDTLAVPSNSWMVLRAESGWLGVALLAGLILFVSIRLMIVFRRANGNRVSFTAFALAGIIALIAIGALWHGFLALPFGRMLLFILLGIGAGYDAGDGSRHPLRAMLGGRDWDPGLAVPVLALVALGWLSVQQARPWSAARLHMQARNSPQAEDLLQEATDIYPLQAELWRARAIAARENFRADPWSEIAFQGLVDLYERALHLNPYRYATYASLASVYELADRPEAAEETLRAGLEYLPRNAALRGWLVRMLLVSGQEAEALRELERLVLDLPPRNRENPAAINVRAETHFRLAELYEQRGLLERAGNHYAIAMLEDPTGPLARIAERAMLRITARIEAGVAN